MATTFSKQIQPKDGDWEITIGIASKDPNDIILAQKYGDISLITDRFNIGLSSKLAVPAGYICILLPFSVTHSMNICGSELINNQLAILPSRSCLDIVTTGLAGSDSLVIPEGIFSHCLQQMAIDSTIFTHPKFISLPIGQLHCWRGLIYKLIRNNSHQFNRDDVMNLLIVLIENICVVDGGCLNDLPNSQFKQVKLAKQVQSYLHEFYQSPINLAQLQADFMVSIRTLQRCFKTYFNMSIFSYLEMYRYNKAHRELKNNNNPHIQQVAFSHGFSHLGRFSTGFKYHFGVSPSKLMKI